MAQGGDLAGSCRLPGSGALTLKGVAQGFITDKAVALLATRLYGQVSTLGYSLPRQCCNLAANSRWNDNGPDFAM